MMKTTIIAGSARKDGDTNTLVKAIVKLSDWDLVDLNDYEISHFDYEHQNREDDFLPLMKKLITHYETFVMVTPVYWYSMSGVMKVFFDRFTDLMTIEKEWGRKLRGKSMAAISCSHGNNLGDSFWLPFSETAHYLGMNYLGNLHTLANQLELEKLQEFIHSITTQK